MGHPQTSGAHKLLIIFNDWIKVNERHKREVMENWELKSVRNEKTVLLNQPLALLTVNSSLFILEVADKKASQILHLSRNDDLLFRWTALQLIMKSNARSCALQLLNGWRHEARCFTFIAMMDIFSCPLQTSVMTINIKSQWWIFLSKGHFLFSATNLDLAFSLGTFSGKRYFPSSFSYTHNSVL